MDIIKRRVIQLAGKTFVVSLPRKWVVKHGIKKGDELDVEPEDGRLTIDSGKTAGIERQTLDAGNMNERVLRWALSSLNKSGVDEIEIINYKPESISVIQELIKDVFLGFAIMEQTPKKCVLKSVSKEIPMEFDATLRRAFQVTLSMGESVIEYIKNGKLKEMKELIALEHTNNQLIDFCERILNKYGHKDYRKTCFVYIIAWNLEKVCDDYKYICDYLSASDNSNIKISKAVVEFIEKANNFLREYYEIFYKYDVSRLAQASDEKKELVKEAEKLFQTKNSREINIINITLNMIIKIKDFSSSIIALNRDESN